MGLIGPTGVFADVAAYRPRKRKGGRSVVVYGTRRVSAEGGPYVLRGPLGVCLWDTRVDH